MVKINPYIPHTQYHTPPIIGGFSNVKQKIECGTYLVEKYFSAEFGRKVEINFEGRKKNETTVRRALFYCLRKFGLSGVALSREFGLTSSRIYMYEKEFKKSEYYLAFDREINQHIIKDKNERI